MVHFQDTQIALVCDIWPTKLIYKWGIKKEFFFYSKKKKGKDKGREESDRSQPPKNKDRLRLDIISEMNIYWVSGRQEDVAIVIKVRAVDDSTKKAKEKGTMLLISLRK